MDLIALCKQAWQKVFGDPSPDEAITETHPPIEPEPPSRELMAELPPGQIIPCPDIGANEKVGDHIAKKPVKRPAVKKKSATKKPAKKR